VGRGPSAAVRCESVVPCAHFAATSFGVSDAKAEFERLSALGVRFTQPPMTMGPVTTAVLDDTCGNLIQIASMP
jgi:predicted enzyme related to lactoylglutathione lyase